MLKPVKRMTMLELIRERNALRCTAAPGMRLNNVISEISERVAVRMCATPTAVRSNSWTAEPGETDVAERDDRDSHRA